MERKYSRIGWSCYISIISWLCVFCYCGSAVSVFYLINFSNKISVSKSEQACKISDGDGFLIHVNDRKVINRIMFLIDEKYFCRTGIYYLRILAKAHDETVNKLKHHLVMVRHFMSSF